MPKTLLQLTQNILSDMDSDEVSSIYDTVEALQVASIIVDTLEAEFNNIDLPSFNRIVQLESVSDVTRPNLLRYPGNVNLIGTLRYRDARNKNRYTVVEYVTPAEFFERQLLYAEGYGPHVMAVTDDSGVSYFIRTNSAPHYYTSVDNQTLIFDSVDLEADDSLQASKTFALGAINMSDAELADDYVFPIPDNLYPLLKAEAKATCFLTLKQMANPKSEQIARRQRSRMQHNIYRSGKANNAYARSKFNFARNR